MAGLLNGLRVQGQESTTTTDAANPRAKDERRADSDADDEDFTDCHAAEEAPRRQQRAEAGHALVESGITSIFFHRYKRKLAQIQKKTGAWSE
ncbi:hypothetical protein NDU88_002878 [Pleurodeles waltl]|uniref:Uncharacterized protein n=1 Tax=Pleurodeles waltl TaxID=8319 RepID=A0AAV7RGY5_PLEWA|nr:hypothetical protein NDU88_002878 [Pleurodeles waltl]